MGWILRWFFQSLAFQGSKVQRNDDSNPSRTKGMDYWDRSPHIEYTNDKRHKDQTETSAAIQSNNMNPDRQDFATGSIKEVWIQPRHSEIRTIGRCLGPSLSGQEHRTFPDIKPDGIPNPGYLLVPLDFSLVTGMVLSGGSLLKITNGVTRLIRI